MLNFKSCPPTVLALFVFVLSNCAERPKAPTPMPQPGAPVVGNDQDAHGCKASAGYQWSELKGSCIRLFESGIRLDPKAPGLDATLSAFIVLKSMDAREQVELFLPNAIGGQILQLEKGTGAWKSAKYKLTQSKRVYTLEDAAGKVLYVGAAGM